MTDPVFDKEGNLSNLDELSREEVASAYQEKNKQLFGRLSDTDAKLKQAEADKTKAEQERDEARKAATPPVPPQQTPVTPPVPTAPQSDPEELRLLARGFSDEEIAKAKILAKGEGSSLTDAVNSDLFKLWKSKKDEEAKKEEAKLGGASGSGAGEHEAPIGSGMSRNDHKAVWKKKLGGK